MDFIVDNYLWFVIGAIVVLMLIIGFIAEKTDFGRKPFSQNKKEKNKKIETSDEEAPIENNENEEPVMESQFELPVEDAQVDDAVVPEADEFETGLENSIEEALPENYDEQLAPELDIPELSDAEEVTEDELQPVEDIAADDSEDDVWKF